MRTAVYIDGFNLYYGSLKGTPYKWLDLCAYFERMLPPDSVLTKVKYFTARVASLPHNTDAPLRQDVYLRALRAHSLDRVEIVEGNFSIKDIKAPLTSNPRRIVEVIRAEEKGSDVNLAVDMVNDAWRDQYDCAVVVSNDADLERALRVVKQQLKKRVLLFTPGAPVRKPLMVLRRWSHKQFGVHAADLQHCQLPSPIIGTVITKPARWR